MPSFIHKPRRKVVLLAAGALGLVVLGALSASVVLLSGAYSTAATTQHFKITHRLLDAGLRFSVRSHASGVKVPDLAREGMLERGAACYRMHCVQCHGAPGVARHPAGRGMLPIASSLAQSAREWPPEWLYYVTRKGVRMSGMPAWEFRIADEDLWSTVAFLTRLPFMTHQDYLDLHAESADFSCRAPTEMRHDALHGDVKVVFRQYACHACHRIEGIVGPKSRVGPPLVDWPRRKYVAGVLPNTEENLIRFIRDPQGVSPHSLMPKLDVGEVHARQMARYLLASE